MVLDAPPGAGCMSGGVPPLWTCCWRTACAGREWAGPALWLELAFRVWQHTAPGAVRGVAGLVIFAVSLGRNRSCADDNA
jgi:hypothetical protein